MSTMTIPFPPCGGRWRAKRDGWGVRHPSIRVLTTAAALPEQPPHPTGSAGHLPPQGGKEIV